MSGFGINTVTVSGNLTRDPELRAVGDANVCTFSLAYNERYKQGDEWKDRAHFFIVNVWGGIGTHLAQQVGKGDQVVVSGVLIQRSWEKDGQKHTSVEIKADSVVTAPRAQQGQAKTPAPATRKPADDDDLPTPDSKYGPKSNTENLSDVSFSNADDLPF